MKSNLRSWHIPAMLALAGAILGWSTVPLFLRSFIHEIDGWTANGVRYPIAGLFWLAPLIYFIRRGEVEKKYFLLAIPPALLNIGSQTLWAWSVYFMEPGKLIFLHRISLVFAILGSFLLFKDERPLIRSSYFWYGLILSVTGFAGMNLMKTGIPWANSWKGLAIVFTCAMLFGLYGVFVRFFMGGGKPWITFPIICLYTSAALFVMMLFLGEPRRIWDMQTPRLVLLVVSALTGIAIAHVCFYYAMQRLGVSISSSCQLINPFITSVCSYYFFGEKLTLGQWIFGLFLIAGASFLLIAQQHLGKHPAPVPACPIAEIAEIAAPEESESLLQPEEILVTPKR
ncbi:MAG: DMT family transporter [Candidatus Omnitrophota bacterium]